VLILEAVQAFLREAVSAGVIDDRHPAYTYDPDEGCYFNASADAKNTSSTGAGIALIVILTLISLLVPGILYLAVWAANPLPRILKRQRRGGKNIDYNEEHSSPIIASFHNLRVWQFDIRECTCTGGDKCGDHRGKATCKKCSKSTVSSKASFCVYTLKSAAVSIYLIGKNLEPILSKYGKCLSCDRSCVEKVSHFSTASLLLSTFILYHIPHAIKFLKYK